MEFEVLGPVRLLRDGEATRLGRMQRLLLSVLLVHANRPVSGDLLADTLWDGVAAARVEQNLRLHIHRLRRLLGDRERLSFGPGGYRLVVRPGELDAERFESLVDEASEVTGDDPQRTAGLLREALALWQGTPYEGLDDPALTDEGQRLTDRRLSATESLYEAELNRGHDAAVVDELTDLVRRYPLRERLATLLMTALYRSGRQADALQVYQDARRRLVDELGLEPGPELRAIEQQVLTGEPVDVGVRGSVSMPVPAQLPPNVRGFAGRDDEIATLNRLLSVATDSTVIATLSGTAGVGKTALAVRWAHRVRDRFPDGQLYVDLRGYGPDAPLAPEDALAGFLRALGVAGVDVPQDLDERAARYRSLLDGRRMLVVLDNARAADQVRPLLPGAASCAVLITSRDSLVGLGVRDGAERIGLHRLGADEARDLMTSLLGDHTAVDTAALDRLIDQCARLPLALRIAVDLVRTRPARGVAGLVAELADERDRLDLLDVDEDPHSAARAVFSWSYRQLSPEAARVFRRCGLHPGREIDVYSVAALVGFDRRAIRRHFDVLVRAHLLEETSHGRFHLHDLLRAYARELAEQDDGRAEALDRLSAYYLQSVSSATRLIVPAHHLSRSGPEVPATAAEVLSFGTDHDAREWLDRERSNLLAFVSDAQDDYPIALSWLLSYYLDRGAYYDDALNLHATAVAAAQLQHDGVAEADALLQLAGAYHFIGESDKSAEKVERALALYRDSDDLERQAAALNNLGSVNSQRGRFVEALRCYQEAMTLRRQVGGLTSSVLTNTGGLLARLGRHDEARSHLEEALRLEEESNDRGGSANTLCHLAEVAVQLGRLEEALNFANQALVQAREIGARAVEMDALIGLGDVWRHLGDQQRSASYHQEALDLARAAHDNPLVVLATIGLARSHAATGAAARAIPLYGSAVEIAASHHLRDEEAAGQDGLGDAYAQMGDDERARMHWQLALGIFDELGVPEADEIAAKLADSP